MVDDSVAYALIIATGFFLAVAFGLLFRYRQASQKLNESTDLGRDLWEALDQRMKRQDQRIIDMMARVDVLQARAMNAQPAPPPLAFPTPAPPVQAPPAVVETPKPPQEPSEVTAPESRPVMASQPATTESPESQPKPEPMKQLEPAPAPLPVLVLPKQIRLDKTSRAALELLKNKSLTTEELWTRLNKGREHTSRVMKNLYEKGLVARDDANKPYTYQLTDAGREILDQSD